MITKLNPNATSRTEIYSLDLDGYSSDKFESLEDYLTKQTDSIVTKQYERGWILRAMNPYNNNYILIFTPQPKTF